MPYRVTSSGRELIAKNILPADFPQTQLVTPKQVVFKSQDGLEIHGQVQETHQCGRHKHRMKRELFHTLTHASQGSIR